MNSTDIQNTLDLHNSAITRRQFFRKNAMGLGSLALGSLLPQGLNAASSPSASGLPHFPPKAKRVIYISLIGAPSQIDLFDHKPMLEKYHKSDMKAFLEKSGQRLTGMTAAQANFPIAASHYKFQKYGKSGMEFSELLPYHGKMADDLCLIKTMYTEAINHEPANQLMYTGSMNPGKASMGSWLSYGLGSLNENLPSFVVLHAKHTNEKANVQAISSRLWGSGYLPGKYSGVNLRSQGDAVLYLKDAPGIDRQTRREMLDGLNALNQLTYDQVGDSEIQTRMQQYEMAFRMQSSVPELTEIENEPDYIYDMYGPQARTKGSFAHCALMARRMAERGVRFTQIFHRGWDQHNNLPGTLPSQAGDVDQPCWALIQDLKQRGMLEDTLVIFGGEFGRTTYCQGTLSEKTYGRDHHPRAFSMWVAGAGAKGGLTYGQTDEYSFNIATPDQKVHVRDLHASILERCGFDHNHLTFKHQGLDQKLTGVNPAKPVSEIFS